MASEHQAKNSNHASESVLERYYELTSISRTLWKDVSEYMPDGHTREAVFHDPYPVYLAHGDGYTVTDVDGKTYLDFFNNATSLIHGHGSNAVVDAAIEAVHQGSALGGPTKRQLAWAKYLCKRVPAVEQIRFANSGTEAVMYAIRAARAYTGKDTIAVFEGVYNGTIDDTLVSVHPNLRTAGPRNRPVNVFESSGIPESTKSDVITLPFNDSEGAETRLDLHIDDLGAIIIAPVMGTKVIPGTEEFITGLQEWTSTHDVPLICDEVVSFRIGYQGAHATYDVQPDLITFGKIIGGGFPVGAFGGRRDIMAAFGAEGNHRIFHSGTFNGNAVTAAAGLAALEAYEEPEIERLNKLGNGLAQKGQKVFDDHGISASFNHCGSLFHIYLVDGAVNDYRDSVQSPKILERKLFLELLNEGVRVSPGGLFGALSTPMGREQIDTFIAGMDRALTRLKPEIRAEAPRLAR